MEEYNFNSYQTILNEMKAILDDCCWNGKIIRKHYKKHPEDIKYQSLLNRSIKLIGNTLGVNNNQYKKLVDFTNHDASSTRGWFLADIYETLKQAFQVFKDVISVDDKDSVAPLDDEKLEYDAFLSYATEDLELAEKIYKYLTNKGKSIWFYKKNVKPGDTVSLKVDYGIRKSKFGILLLSKDYLNKNWPRKEYSAFLKKAYDSGKDLIIPLYYRVNNVLVSEKSSFLSDIDAIVIKGNFKDVIKRIINRLEYKKKSEETDRIYPTIKRKRIRKESFKPLPKLWYKKPWVITIFVSVFVVVLSGIILLSVFEATNRDKDISDTESAAVVETSDEDTNELSTSTTEDALESTISSETTDIDQDGKDTNETVLQNEAPALKLEIIEGPTLAEGGTICYYRVEAIVTGDPDPTIKFSKDDSNGSWGSNITQINLNYGESYTLTADLSNTEGIISDSIKLEWADENTNVASGDGDILYNVANGVEFRLNTFTYWSKKYNKLIEFESGDTIICSDISGQDLPSAPWVSTGASFNPPQTEGEFQYIWYRDGIHLKTNRYNLSDDISTEPYSSAGLIGIITDPGFYRVDIYFNSIHILSGCFYCK